MEQDERRRRRKSSRRTWKSEEREIELKSLSNQWKHKETERQGKEGSGNKIERGTRQRVEKRYANKENTTLISVCDVISPLIDVVVCRCCCRAHLNKYLSNLRGILAIYSLTGSDNIFLPLFIHFSFFSSLSLPLLYVHGTRFVKTSCSCTSFSHLSSMLAKKETRPADLPLFHRSIVIRFFPAPRRR